MKTDELISKLSADHKEVQPVESLLKRYIKWLFISALCISSSMAIIGIREDWRVLFENPVLLVETFFILLAALLSSAAALVLSVPGREKSKRLKLFVLSPLFLWGTLIVYSLTKSESFYIDSGYICMADISFIGILPGLCLFYLIKKGATLSRGYAGFFAVLASAGIGAWALQFTCHIDDPVHLFVWHFLPTFLLGVLGIKIGFVVLKKI